MKTPKGKMFNVQDKWDTWEGSMERSAWKMCGLVDKVKPNDHVVGGFN